MQSTGSSLRINFQVQCLLIIVHHFFKIEKPLQNFKFASLIIKYKMHKWRLTAIGIATHALFVWKN